MWPSTPWDTLRAVAPRADYPVRHQSRLYTRKWERNLIGSCEALSEGRGLATGGRVEHENGPYGFVLFNLFS